MALRQLGVPVALVGVVGDDRAGAVADAQAGTDGIDGPAMARRRGAVTALLTPDDVAAATDRIAAAQVVSLQLQQPGAAVVGALVVVGGAAEEDATRRGAVAHRPGPLRADDARDPAATS